MFESQLPSIGAGRLGIEMPARLERAIGLLRELEGQGIHFAPIRHHSPACAQGVDALIASVRPATVLIEGPEEYTSIVGELLRKETVPPIAILSATGTQAGHGGFFPMAAYSPEWVALQAASRLGANVSFIDQSWSERRRDPEVDEHERLLTRSIQAERYLSNSRTLVALARREHCRDQDELWDQLFELRDIVDVDSARRLLDDIFVWSALARLEYEPPVLVAEGSIEREALMSARIAEHRARQRGPIVVVTGAFHTLAIVEALAGASEGEIVRAARPIGGYPPIASGSAAAWLVRFDYARLDSLNGYGAGMPSPGYYARVWNSRSIGDPTRDILLDIARSVSASSTSELLGISDVSAAMIAATRLAQLRGRPKIGRTDLLDAILSTFTKGDASSSPALRDALRSIFVGNDLGEVAPDTAAPPVVAEARGRATSAGLSVSDSVSRTVSLDPRRKPQHRSRSQFLALMEFLGTGFSHRIAGPDFVAGRGLGRLFEDWDYAWTPLVEARLIDLSDYGFDLDEIVVRRIAQLEIELNSERGQDRSAAAVTLLALAAVIGLENHIDRLAELVNRQLEADSSVKSVLAAATRLLALVTGRDQLGLGNATSIKRVLASSVSSLAFLVSNLAGTPPELDDEAVETIVELRGLLLRLGEEDENSVEPVKRELRRLRGHVSTSPSVDGALTALAAIDGEIDEAALASVLGGQLGSGADALASVRFLTGFMRAAPDLILRDQSVFETVDRSIRSHSTESFLEYLPDLRRAFSRLKPTETAALAERISAGGAADLDRVRSDLTGADLETGIRLQRALAESLAADGLAFWAGADQ